MKSVSASNNQINVYLFIKMIVGGIKETLDVSILYFSFPK